MYGQPRGGLQHCIFRTRNMMLKYCACQAHRDAFFYDSYRRKGSSVPEPCEFEVGRRLAGGRQGEYPKDGVPCALMPPLGSWDNNITDWRVPCALMSTANKGGACCMSGG